MTDRTAVSDLQRETDAFRQRLIAMDRQASAVLSQSFAQVLDGLEPRLQSLERQIAQRLAAGETVSADWLFKQDRYRTLIRETNQLMTQYGAVTQTVTTAAQQAAVRASLAEAGRELMAVSGGSDIAQLAAGWAAIPEQSVINMVGALQASTPLGQLFAGFGPDAVKDVNRALVQGLALGLNPRETARSVRSALNISRARAETIVRTETLRAANKSMIAAFEESGVVKGWRWSASLSPRTCVACLSRHGKVYPLSKAMDRHVNCRCSASPWIGDGSDVEWESGSDWLKRQPPSLQDTVLGREGGSLFRSGNLLLDDFERVTTSRAWGPSVSDGGVQWAKRQAAAAGRSGGGTATSPLARTFDTNRDAAQWRRSLGGSWPEEQLDGLSYYRASGYHQINGMLRDPDALWDQLRAERQYSTADILETQRELSTYIAKVDDSLAQVTTPEAVTVWRGTKIDAFGVTADELPRLVGTQISDLGYTSTSLHRNAGEKFYDWAADDGSEAALMEIRVPAGTNVVPMNNAFPDSALLDDEEELILPRGSTFTVSDVTTTSDGRLLMILEMLL
jgi:SPP1 gp7 family putative phage head morphogenesis protein